MSRVHRLDWLLIIVVSAAVSFTALGRYGFRSTEGHRVIPAWTMLDAGGWWTPRMFQTPYLRKPPGIQWAIAAFSWALGKTEFAARAVSATAAVAMALAAWWFATRWFGRRWGLVAGLTQALYPQFWSSSRSAEIEALNNLGTLASVFLIVHIMIAKRNEQRAPAHLGMTIALAASLCVAALAKGPASGPVIAAAILAGCLVTRSWNITQWRSLIGGIALATCVLALIASAIVRHLPDFGEPVVTETDTAGFFWDVNELGKIVTLAPVALIYALPASLSLMAMIRWWWTRRPLPNLPGPVSSETQHGVAQALALTCLLGLAGYTLLGIHNLRYTLPATTMLAPLAAYVMARLKATGGGRQRTFVARHALTLAAIALLGGAAAFIRFYEPIRGSTSGLEPGRELAAHLPDGTTIWAEDMIEARPELLLYAMMDAAERGRSVRPLWKKTAIRTLQLPPPGTWMLLSRREHAAYSAHHPSATRQVTTGRVHEFDFVLVEVTGPGE